MSTESKVIEMIQIADAAMAKAAAAEATHAERDAKIAAEIPAVVQAMVDGKRIEPHQKEALAQALRDPLKTLELLAKTAKHRNVDESQRLGTAVPSPTSEKTAKYRPLGARSSEELPRDRIFAERILGTRS